MDPVHVHSSTFSDFALDSAPTKNSVCSATAITAMQQKQQQLNSCHEATRAAAVLACSQSISACLLCMALWSGLVTASWMYASKSCTPALQTQLDDLTLAWVFALTA